MLFEELRKELGSVLRELTKHKESEILEGRMLLDHVHMLIAIPPKYAVSQVVGYMKGKSAIHVARTYLGRERNFTGQHFWARGYYVSTVGLDKVVLDFPCRSALEQVYCQWAQTPFFKTIRIVMLSEAKHLVIAATRPFASLRVTVQ